MPVYFKSIVMSSCIVVEVTKNTAGAAEEYQYLNQLQEDLKVIFLTDTLCKIRFIYVGFNCKEKKWGKKYLEIMGGGLGVRRLMEKSILNFHFDYWNISLRSPGYEKKH